MAVRNERGQFVKGNPGGPGRPKGSKNRRPPLEDAVVAAFAEGGGPPDLVWMAQDRPREFVKLLVEAMAHSIQVPERGREITRPEPLKRRAEPAEPVAVGGLLEAVLSDLGVGEKLRECRALLAWEEAAGAVVAAQARPLRMRRGRLELAVPSAVWRTQLTFAKDDLLRRVNELAGDVVVREIVILNQPLEKGLSFGGHSAGGVQGTADR